MGKKYCESLAPGFYLLNATNCKRCFYITGTLKGNKWIDLEVPNPAWMSLMWTCINKDTLSDCTFYENDPVII